MIADGKITEDLKQEKSEYNRKKHFQPAFSVDRDAFLPAPLYMLAQIMDLLKMFNHAVF